MAKTRKPVKKKTSVAKKTTKAKPQAKTKTTPKSKSKIYTPINKLAGKAVVSPRRPAVNPDMPISMIENLQVAFAEIKADLEEYAAHLRALDRKRLNGVGIKTQGFIERAYELAFENQEFLPHYLTIEKFEEDNKYFANFQVMVDLVKQIQELLLNITIQSADMVYTDALEFYASVREAAKRRVDAAESLHKELEIFFRKRRSEPEIPTDRKLKRDVNGIIRGTKDGRIEIENIKPKMTKGKHIVIDETYKDTAAYKETEEEEISE